MNYEISKELFEVVMNIETERLFYRSDEMLSSSIAMNENLISINDFFFKCIDFIESKGQKLNRTIDNSEELKAAVFAFCEELIKEGK